MLAAKQQLPAAKGRPAPLEGIRVLDFTHVIAGPFTTQILGDLGATVIKIEGVDSGDVGRDMGPMRNGQSHYFVTFNRNKRSVALDLKSDAGKAAVRRLVEQADVLVENFAPKVMARLGFGYDAVKAINPGIVYCSVSGFGQTGPLADKRSLDIVAQAYSGIMSTNGDQHGPPLKVGVPIGDTASSLFASIGLLAALYRRRATGEGEYLDVSMYDSLLTLLGNHGGYARATGAQPARAGSGHYFTVPYGTFEAADGEIVIAIMTDANWLRLCESLHIDDLAADPRLRTLAGRAEHREEVYARLGPELRKHSVSSLIDLFGRNEVPCAPVNDIASALRHPHTAARGMTLSMAHPEYGNVEATSLPLRSLMRDAHTAPPVRGEHTVEVLRELGMTDAAIAALLADRHAWQSPVTREPEGAPVVSTP